MSRAAVRAIRSFLAKGVLSGCLLSLVQHASAAPVVITEFFNSTLRHYVLITSQAEVAAIESGAAGPGWYKTGKTLNAHTDPGDAPGLVPVCRFYGSIAPGPNSHFFTADKDECEAVKTDPGWHYEGIAFYVALPAAGECAEDQLAVWRAYNNGFRSAEGINDGNHRFSTDYASIRKLADNGWRDEGLVFCARADNPSVPVVLTAYPATALLLPGASRDVRIRMEPRNGFSGQVALSAAGLPSGISGEFLPPSPVIAGEPVNVVLRLTTSASASPSDATIVNIKALTTTGTSGIAGVSVRIAAADDATALKLAAIAAVEQRFQELRTQNLTPLALVRAMAAFMATLPAYEATGVHEDTICAWGRFKDGTLHIVANNLEPLPGIGARTAIGPRKQPAKAAGTAELPAEVVADVRHSFGSVPSMHQPVLEMHDYLRAKNWKLRPSGPVYETHVGSLITPRGDKGYGFVHLAGHGGAGSGTYAVWTSTVVDDDYERIFSADLAAKRLVHMTGDTFLKLAGPNPTEALETRYAFTGDFVRAYMKFAHGSVVWITACSSASDLTFVYAFIDQGASAYLGWSSTLSLGTVPLPAPYFVDRMLGANLHSMKESPPQRPFPLFNVLADMDKKGLSIDKYRPQNRLEVYQDLVPGVPTPIFAPSIKRVWVNEHDEELTLEGFFGPDKPKVTVGGAERDVKTWSADKITTDLPQTGGGSSGDVIVDVRGVKSNARQLSEWAVPLTYTWTDVYDIPGLLLSGAHAIRFRGDVGAYRDVIAETPKYQATGGPPTKDSGLTLTASGSGSAGGCNATLSGTGTYASPTSPAAVDGTVLASGFQLDGDAKTGYLGLAFGSFSSPHSITLTGSPSCNQTFKVAAYMGQLDGFFDVPRSQLDPSQTIKLSAATLTLDADYGIGGKVLVDNHGGGEIKVSWPAVPAGTPPRDTDDAGK